MNQYNGAIFLVRNPYKAVIAEFNRLFSKGRDQLGRANSSLLYSKSM